MNISAILVITTPAKIDACVSALENLSGIAISHFDPATGKIIVTQEAESVDAEVEGLKRIKLLQQVLMAEMIYHYFEEDEMQHQQMPTALDELQGLGELPTLLKNTTEN